MELTPSDIMKIEKTAMLFTQWESRWHRNSFVVKGLRYNTTASPFTPRICSTLDFCNVRVYLPNSRLKHLGSQYIYLICYKIAKRQTLEIGFALIEKTISQKY